MAEPRRGAIGLLIDDKRSKPSLGLMESMDGPGAMPEPGYPSPYATASRADAERELAKLQGRELSSRSTDGTGLIARTPLDDATPQKVNGLVPAMFAHHLQLMGYGPDMAAMQRESSNVLDNRYEASVEAMDAWRAGKRDLQRPMPSRSVGDANHVALMGRPFPMYPGIR